MTSKKTSLIKIGLIYTISNIIVKGISFLTTPIFTRLMSQSEFGEFNSISSWVNILVTIATLDLYSAINVAKYDHGENIEKYLSSSLIFGNIVTTLLYIITELNISYAEQFLKMDRFYIRIIFAYLFFYPAVQLLLAKFRIYNEYKKVLILTWINMTVSVISQITLVYLMTDKLLGKFLGTYGAVTICNAIFWVIIIVKGKAFSSVFYKHALRLAVPLVPHVLSGVLLGSSDRIMINSICGSEEAALYSLAYTISSIAGLVLTSLNQAWVPWLYDRIDGNRLDIRKSVNVYMLLFGTFCCIGMLFGPEAILIFGGKKYISSLSVIPPVIFALMLRFVYTQYVNIEFFRKKNIWISVATITATIVNIGLNFWLLPIFGYIAGAYTTVAGFAVMVIMHIVVVKRVTNDYDLYNLKVLLFGVVAVACWGIISLVLYKYTIFRYCIIILSLAVVINSIIKYKSALKQYLKL